MPRKDLYNKVKVITQDLGSISTTTNSMIVDTLGYDSVVCHVHTTMTTADTSNYFTPTLYESDVDNATPLALASYSAVASADLIGAFTARNSTVGTAQESVGYIGGYRYLFLSAVETSTAVGSVVVTWVLSNSAEMPVTSTVTNTALTS